MKAWICDAFGEEPQWRDVPDPVVQPGQVLIDVAACGVNFADTLILQGKYQSAPAALFLRALKSVAPCAPLGMA